jgi:hypothetical protein
MYNENEPRQTSWLVFRDAPDGSPTSWVSPCVSPSPNSLSSENEPPTSLWKGEGLVRLDFVRPCWLGAIVIEPTSLNRGEGLFGGRLVWLRANRGGEGKSGGGSMGEDEQISTVMGLMFD